MSCSSSDSPTGAGSGDSGSTTTATTTTLPIGPNKPAQVPAASPREAVQAVLAAEQKGDHAASYALLSDGARRQYKDLAEWQQRLTELPPVIGFDYEADGTPGQVKFLVRHTPGLDPFLGLSPGSEHQTWTAVEVDGGWLVDANPDVDYVVPPDADAQTVATRWATAVQSCDRPAAEAEQAIPELFGASTAASSLCKAEGAVTAGTVGDLEAGPTTADLVAQYSSDALVWGRVVPVTTPAGTINVELAPIGTEWKVIGVFD